MFWFTKEELPQVKCHRFMRKCVGFVDLRPTAIRLCLEIIVVMLYAAVDSRQATIYLFMSLQLLLCCAILLLSRSISTRGCSSVVERMLCMYEAPGSIPGISTFYVSLYVLFVSNKT